MNEFIYILKIMPLFNDVHSSFIYNNTINGMVFEKLEDAIEYGKKHLKAIAFDYLSESYYTVNDSDIIDFYSSGDIHYKFIITKYISNGCKNSKELLEKYKPGIHTYTSLMKLIGFEDLYYDYSGNLINTIINDKFFGDINFSSKPFMGFTLDNFKIGDYVVFSNDKNCNPKVCMIKDIIDFNKYNLTELSGYILYDPIYEQCINDSIGSRIVYDQDLIKVDICPQCFSAITNSFKDSYSILGKCPRCLKKIELLEKD